MTRKTSALEMKFTALNCKCAVLSLSMSSAFINSTQGRLCCFCIFVSSGLVSSYHPYWHHDISELEPCLDCKMYNCFSATNTSSSYGIDFLAVAAMFYDYLFYFLDSIPTVTFIAWFTPIYFSLHYVAFRLFLLHPRFRGVSLDKQTFILINFMESLLLALMR